MREVVVASFLILGLLATLGHADDEAVCAQSCRYPNDGRPGIHYVPGHTYQYQYEGQAATLATAVQGQESKMSVSATVTITARTPCDLKMQVSNIKMDSGPSQNMTAFSATVEAHDLHFSFQDGQVEYICPHDEEDIMATNFKRGILSTLQMSVTHVDDMAEVVAKETDVGGECLTRYNIENPGKLTVTKTKEKCRTSSHFPYAPHVRHNDYRSTTDLPFFKRTQSCRMERGDAGVWERVECTEELLVEGTTSTLASVNLKTVLELQAGHDARSDTPEGFYVLEAPPTKKESLKMDLEGISSRQESHVDPDMATAQAKESLEFLVSTLSDSALLEGRPLAFAELVSRVGLLEEGSLNDMWTEYREMDGYREFLLDAVMVCEHPHCVQLITYLAQADTVSLPDSRLKTWLTGVHFHANVQPKSLQYVMDLANAYTEVPSVVLMAASSMVYRLCQQDPKECRDSVAPFLEYVKEQVGDTCGYGETRERQNDVKLVLRALGNAGVLPYESLPEMCYKNRDLATDVRLAALQTYRRMGCVKTEAPWKILEDEYDHVEVRIKAYLALVPCATETPGFFKRIQDLLEKEDLHQVGSYIFTHVRNLAEEPGTSSHDQDLAKLATHPKLSAKFNTNPLRSSRNYRYAHFSEMLNLGGSVGGDVIFSDSYIPRHASLNLTLDVLEKSFNVLEIGGDFASLEEHVDRLLGRETAKDRIEEEKILKLQRIYDEARTANELEGLNGEEPSASVFLRVFGQEVVYFDNVLRVNPLETLQQIIREMSVPKSSQLLNQEIVSPTILGFPLRLKVNATGSVTFTREGTLDMTNGRSYLLEGHLNPSAVVAVDETLILDGIVSFSGVRRRTTQKSHMNLGMKVEVMAGELVDVQLNLPEEEVVKVSSSSEVGLFNNVDGGWTESQQPAEDGGDGLCTPEGFEKVVGLRFCVDRGLQVTRTDTFDHYKFTFKNQEDKIEVLFDTPGSAVDRRFNVEVNTNPENFGGTLAYPGKSYELRGEMQTSRRNRKVEVKYLEDEEVQGELMMNLISRDEGFKVTYTPKVTMMIKDVGDFNLAGMLAVGDGVLSAEGTLVSSIQYEPLAFKASWERQGDKQSLEGLIEAGQLGRATGSTSFDPNSVMVQLKGDYFLNLPEPHSVALMLDFSNTPVQGRSGIYKGEVSAMSSQAQFDVGASYLFREGHLDVAANATVLGKETSTKIVLKNLVYKGDRDLQITASFMAPQLDIDCLTHLVYLNTKDARELEVGLNLGPLIQTKAAFTYVLKEDPLHALLGVELMLNERHFKAGYNVDMSQPFRALIMANGNLDTTASSLRFDLTYDPSNPFNLIMEGYGGGDPMTSSGVSFMTSSDPSWTMFEGAAKVKYLDWSSTVSHNVTWSPAKKSFKVTLNDKDAVEFKAETSPDFLFAFLISGEHELQAGIQRTQIPEQDNYQVYFTSGTDKLLNATAVLRRDHTFSGSLRLLESQAEVTGQYEQPYAGDLLGSTSVTVTLPSGQTYSTDLMLNHTYDGATRNLMLSSSYGDDLLKGHVTITQEDGWFSAPVNGFAFRLETPFTRLKNVGLALESRGDSLPSFAEFEWDELKVRGESVVGDYSQLEMKFIYADGGTCDSHFHVYNKFVEDHYMTGASLGLTTSHDPWMVEVNTTLGYGSCDLMVSVGAPVLSSPLEGSLMYELTSSSLEFQAQAGMVDGETTAMAFSGRSESSWGSSLRTGSLMLDVPGIEPLVLNVTNYEESDLFNATLEFTSALEPINSVKSEFGIYYTGPGEAKLLFNLTHDELLVGLELTNKGTGEGYSQQLKGTVNGVEITYELETSWDYGYIPKSADGKIAVMNLQGHNLDLTVSHGKNSSAFSTKVLGSWDDQQFQAEHWLQYESPLQWSSKFDVLLPNQDQVKSDLSLSAQEDLSSFECGLNFTSPWTEPITALVTAEPKDSSLHYNFMSMHGDSLLAKATLLSSVSPGWDESEFLLELTSSYFENCSLVWEHNMDSGNLASVELRYGTDFSMQITNNLTLTQGWFSQDFSEYNFHGQLHAPTQGIDFKSDIMFDSQYHCNLEAMWADSSVMLQSAIGEGIIFKALMDIPDYKYQADLEYHEGNCIEIPDFDFRLGAQGEDILVANTTTNSLYPELDLQLTFQYLLDSGAPMKNGLLNVTLDLSDIEDYTFSGFVGLISDFEGFENYALALDTKMNTNQDNWDAGIDVELQVLEQAYDVNMSGSLALHDLPYFRFNTRFGESANDQLLDQKEVHFMLGNPILDRYQTNVTLDFGDGFPHWSLFLSYNHTDKDIVGYVIPDGMNKYEVGATLNTDNLIFNSQRVNDDGSTFVAAEGKITWDVDSPKKMVTLSMSSDFEAIKEVSGEILIQESRGMEASANFMLNQENFVASLKYEARGSGNSGRIIVGVENNIAVTFMLEANLEFIFTEDEFKADVKINLNNQADYIKAFIKGSLEESYLRIEMPFEDWEKVDLTVNIMTEENFRLIMKMKVPKFCFNFDGKLDHTFLEGSVNINVQDECSATALFEFNMNYKVNGSEITMLSDCYVQGLGIFFRIEGKGKAEEEEYHIDVKSEFYPDYSLGFEFLLALKQDEPGLKLHVYEVATDTTYFLLNSNFSKTRTEIILEVLQDHKIEVKADYDIQPSQALLDATYQHNVLGHSLDAKLTGEGNFKENFGDAEIHFNTDGAFGHADLEVEYDLRKDIKEGNFKLATSNGGAEGKLQVQQNAQITKITYDMSSTLHSFENYHYDFLLENKINGKTLSIFGSQDDIKYNFTGSAFKDDEEFMADVIIHTPFQILDMFEIGFRIPQAPMSDDSYKVTLGGVTSGEFYGLSVQHHHNDGWSHQETKIDFTTPEKLFSNFTTVMNYDFESQAAVYVNSTRGCIGFETKWQSSEVLFGFEVHSYLTLLGLGEHSLSASIPLDLLEKGELRVEAKKTSYDFIAMLMTGEKFSFGNVTIMIMPETFAFTPKVYNINYELGNPFYLNGQFDEWKVSTKWDFTGSQIPALSGRVKIQTNFPEYEVIDGSWEMNQKNSIHSMQMKIDMRQKETIFLSASFDNHPRGSSSPWKGVKLDVLFGSPFTLTHSLRAQYQLEPLGVSVVYKHGYDTFKVDLTTDFHPLEGAVALVGNVPIPGVSVFNIDLKYKMSDRSQNFNFKAKVEETILEASGNAKGDWSDGVMEASFVSPFASPANAQFTWSAEKTRVTYNTKLEYKQQEIRARVALEQTSRSVKLDVLVSTPFEGWKESKIHLGYTWLSSSFTLTTVLTKEENQIFGIKSSFLLSNSEIAFNAEGSLEPLKTSGLLVFECSFGKDAYTVKFQEKFNDYELLEFQAVYDEYHFGSWLKYGKTDILSVTLNYNKAEMYFTWARGQYFNVTLTHAPTNRGHEFDFYLRISNNRPVTMNFIYSSSDGHQVTLTVSFGEKKYILTGKITVDKKQYTISTKFESSDDVENPITIDASFDLTNFIKGKMKTVTDLIKVSIEWGGETNLTISGLRHKNAMKIIIDATTPSEVLPKFHLGFDGGFRQKPNSLDVKYQLNVEWSETIDISGVLRYKKEFFLQNTLKTSFPLLENIESELLLKPGHIMAGLIINGNEWRLKTDYSISIPFTLKVEIKTPLQGLETLLFTSSMKIRNKKVDVDLTFSWPNDNVIALKLQAEMWSIKIKLSTPWAPFKEAAASASLRTESEKVSSKATLQWDGSTLAVTFDYTPKEFALLGKYNQGETEVVKAEVEYVKEGNNFKVGAGIKTIYETLKLFSTNFVLGPQGISLEVTVNEIMSRLKGSYAEGAIKFTVDIPFLYDFAWNLEAKQDWTKLDSHSTVTYPMGTTPLNITFNYTLQPSTFTSMFEVAGDEKYLSFDIDISDTWSFAAAYLNTKVQTEITPSSGNLLMKLKYESMDFDFNEVNVDITSDYGKQFEFVNITAVISTGFSSQNVSTHEVTANYAFQEESFLFDAMFNSTSINGATLFHLSTPLKNILVEDGLAVISLLVEESQYKFSFENRNIDNTAAAWNLVLEFPEWIADILIGTDEESATLTLLYPKPSDKHELVITWPDVLSVEKFTIEAELNTPYLGEGPAKSSVKFVALDEFYFKFESDFTYGNRKIDLEGDFQYDETKKQMLYDSKVKSDWIGNYALDVSTTWMKNITFDTTLKILEDKHNVFLEMDLESYSVGITANSPWLPYENFSITASLNEDFTPYNMHVEGKFTMGESEVLVEGEFHNKGLESVALKVSVNKNIEEVFLLDLNFEQKDPDFAFEFIVKSTLPELNTSLMLRKVTQDNETEFSVEVDGFLALYNDINIYSYTSVNQQHYSLRASSNNYEGPFHLECKLSLDEYGYPTFRYHQTSNYDYIYIGTAYKFIDGFDFDLQFINTFWELELLTLEIDFPESKRIYFVYTYKGQSGSLNIFSPPSAEYIILTLITPFKGYEMFTLTLELSIEPRASLVAMLEYPGGRVGIDSYYEGNAAAFTIALPFEKYDIISFRFNPWRDGIEVRVGKVGFGATADEKPCIPTDCSVMKLSFNEMEIMISFSVNLMTKNVYDLHIEFKSIDFIDINELDIQLELTQGKMYKFLVKSELEEYLRLQASQMRLAILTPFIFPWYLDINFENSDEVAECRVRVGVDTGLAFERYGFHIRQEALEAGSHFSLSGDAAENSFYAEGILSLDFYHLDERFVLELNKNYIGYSSNFQILPGLFTDEFKGAMELMLPGQTVRWNSSALCGAGDFDLQSRFTWNELDPDTQPITLAVKYEDDTVFGNGEHQVKAVFSHPNIEDIMFHGMIVLTEESKVSGMAEFLDKNVPEMNVTMAFDMYPPGDDGMAHFTGNVSQLHSGFLVIVDNKVTRSPGSVLGDYSIKYWSLTKESWENISLATAMENTQDGYDFKADIATPEGDWGYNYQGSVYSWENSALFTISGNSKQYKDFWKIQSSVNKYTPELSLQLGVGQGNHEPYEQGRLRVGLHNPVEMGAVLDHRKFGEWQQKTAVGMRLKTKSILQFVLEFDPSLDFQDDYYLADLISPADQITEKWWRDLTSTPQALGQWVLTEGPTVLAVLVNRPTLLSVWEKEGEHLVSFVNNLNMTIADISIEAAATWTEVIQPSLDLAYDYGSEIYTSTAEVLSGSVEFLSQLMSDYGSQLTILLQEEWIMVEEGLRGIFDQLSAWVGELAFQATEFFVSFGDSIISSWISSLEAVQTVFSSVGSVGDPFLSVIVEAFSKYLEDLSAVIGGQCGQRLTERLEELLASLTQDLSGGAQVLLEFLQTEEYVNRVLQMWDVLSSWTATAAEAVEGIVARATLSLADNSAMLMFSSLAQRVQDYLSFIQTEGFRAFIQITVSELRDYAAQGVDSGFSLLKEAVMMVKERPIFSAGYLEVVPMALGDLLENVEMTWQKWRSGERLDVTGFERFLFFFMDRFHKYLESKNYLLDEIIIYDPYNYGRVHYSQFLPVQWNSFLDAPEWSRLTRIFAKGCPIAEAYRLLELGMLELQTAWWVLPPPGVLLPVSTLPQPFTATATVMGQHVTTFDQHHYEFLGPCSYLLTKDFEEGDFEVVGVYESHKGVVMLESVLVRGPGTDVTLHVDGTVDVTYTAAEVTSESGRSRLKSNELEVICSRLTQGCSITVAGKYFGRLAGMLGNYNYEPADDGQGPDGSVTSSVSELARKWSVSSQACYHANQAIEIDDLHDAVEVEECTRLFLNDRTSAYASCFSLVDPRPYFWHCVNDLSRPQSAKGLERSSCDAIESYRVMCGTEGVVVPSLDTCVERALASDPARLAPIPTGEGDTPTCPILKEERVPVGWSHVFQGARNGSLDVGLVLEDASCHEGKDFRNLLKEVGKGLTKAGYGDVRYSLLKYEEDQIGDVTEFIAENKMAAKLRDFKMVASKAQNGGSEAVIRASRRMKWRPGVGRVLLQATCQTCEDDNRSVREALRENDVVLHVLSRLTVTLEGPKTKESDTIAYRIFGYDKNLVFTSSDYRTFQGDAGLRELLQEQGGSCIDSLQASGGAVFNSNRWIPKKKGLTKKFLAVVSHRVATNVPDPDCHRCQCQANSEMPVLSCRPCGEVQEENPIVSKIVEDFLEDFTASESPFA